ncbi:MAG: hypothetical protein AAF221_04915 [Pseudomonadota bacterium]
MTTWLLRLFLIALPILILIYWILMRKKASNTGQDVSVEERRIALTGGIVFLIVLALLIFVVPFGGHSPDDVYIAPRQENGKIIPGEFISKEEAKKRGLLKTDLSPPPEELEPFGD